MDRWGWKAITVRIKRHDPWEMTVKGCCKIACFYNIWIEVNILLPWTVETLHFAASFLWFVFWHGCVFYDLQSCVFLWFCAFAELCFLWFYAFAELCFLWFCAFSRVAFFVLFVFARIVSLIFVCLKRSCIFQWGWKVGRAMFASGVFSYPFSSAILVTLT